MPLGIGVYRWRGVIQEMCVANCWFLNCRSAKMLMMRMKGALKRVHGWCLIPWFTMGDIGEAVFYRAFAELLGDL